MTIVAVWTIAGFAFLGLALGFGLGWLVLRERGLPVAMLACEAAITLALLLAFLCGYVAWGGWFAS